MTTAHKLDFDLPTTSDEAGTKETVSFTPEQISPELSTFVSRPTDGLVIGTQRISVRYSPASKQRAYAKATVSVAMPRTGVLASGATGVVATPRLSLEVQLPETCNAIDRARLSALMQEMLVNPIVNSALFKLDPIY